MAAATDRELIESWLRAKGQSAESWNDDEGDTYAQLPGKWLCVEDVDDEMEPWSGEEGIVRISVVGAEQYHNRRVACGFKAEGTEAALEVDLDYLEPAA